MATKKKHYHRTELRNRAILRELESGESLTSKEIAEKYGVSAGRVRNLRRRLLEEMRPQFEGEIKAIREVHTRRLEGLFWQAFAAWKASCEDAVELKEAVIERDEDGNPTRWGVIERKTKGQSGNPANLKEMREILRDIRDIYGANEPQKVTPVDSQGRPIDADMMLVAEQTRVALLADPKYIDYLRQQDETVAPGNHGGDVVDVDAPRNGNGHTGND